MPTFAEVNQAMLDAALGRMARLDALERQIAVERAAPAAPRSALDRETALVRDARGLLEHEVELRQKLRRACAGSACEDPEQDPAVRQAAKDLNAYKKRTSAYD